MTTRKHPRSLIEAFPSHYPHSITRHKRPLPDRVADVLAAVICAVGILAIALHSMDALW